MSDKELRPAPEPLQIEGVPVIIVGTALWGVALVVLLLLHDRLSDAGRGWWIWVGVAGFVLGLIGIPYLRRFERKTAAHS